ncbi:MAG: TROVE domain-containing protein [Planctomycetota bacterium]|jgi:60 kDa SS-A/Ro ribonucleoprotein
MSKTYQSFSTKKTPQSEPIPGEDMVKNAAGGYVYAIDKWQRLVRFLILGTEGGTYYAKEQELTKDNALAVLDCINEDGIRTIDTIVDISDQGRAVRNTPALFALAMCSGLGNEKTKAYAYKAMPKVARIGTHVLMWAQYTQQFQGTGPGWRKAISGWFNDKDVDKLAYQAIKYQQREGWAMSDLLRLAHPVPVDDAHDTIYKWIVDKEFKEDREVPKQIWAFEVAKKAKTGKEIVSLIENYRIPREAIPTEFLNQKQVWDALLSTNSLPMMGMLRNLGKMTNIELLNQASGATAHVIENLRNAEAIKKSRLHPLSILVAMKIYRQGHGMRGSLKWLPVGRILDALDEAFYLSFGNVEPTGKRTMLSLDVSGSMTSGIVGLPLSCRDASGAMAMVTARVEPNYLINGFYTKSTGRAYGYGQRGVIEDLPITPRQRLEDVIQVISGLNFGGTDCSLPMVLAVEKEYEIDTFVIYTDNETWAGEVHASQALRNYRKKSGIPAKLVVCAMTPTQFSIADPEDAGMLDVAGFDTSTPQVISEFSK